MALGNLQELIPAIFTGPNGERLTPEQIAQRQEIAQSLMARATDTRPDAGGIASVLTKGLLGFQGAMDSRSADNAIKANSTASEANMSAMLGSLGLGGGNAYPSSVTSGSSPTSAVATNTAPLQASPLAEGSEWLKYANQGAIRNQPINEKLTGALSFLPEMGVTMKVVSGGETADRKASNSGRHMHGNAADVDFYVGDRKLTPKNDQDRAMLSQIVQRGKAAGITGWGEGDDYMGSGRVHLGFGNAGVWGAKGKGANAPEWLVNAYNSPYQPTSAANAIESIFPLEQGDSNPSLPMGQLPQTEGAYIDPTVAVVQGGQITPTAFDARFSGSPEQVARIQQPAQSPQVPQQAAIDPRLAQLNDMALGGALSESGGSPVAQALAGYFPDAPSANRAPIMQQQGAGQMPMQQAAPQTAQQPQMGGINPAVIQALSSPYATAQEKQIAGLLLNKQMEQQSTAQAQQQEIQRRQQVAQAAGIDPMFANDPKLWEYAAKSKFEGPKTATVGNAVIDVATGKPIYQAPDSTSNMKDYDAYANDIKSAGGTPLNRLQYEQEIRKAGSTNITTNVGGDSDEYRKEFDKSMGSAQAKTFTDAMNTGDMARRSRVNLDRLSQLAQSAPQGLAGAAIRSLGEYGIKTEGLGTVQAMESLISQLVPSQRPPGSGVISDADLALYKASLPRLINSPEGNKLILDTLYAINDHDIAASDIASRVADRDLTAAEGRAEMRKIPNPFSNWRDKTSNVGAGDKSRNDPLSTNKRIQDMSDDELRALANGN